MQLIWGPHLRTTGSEPEEWGQGGLSDGSPWLFTVAQSEDSVGWCLNMLVAQDSPPNSQKLRLR